MENVITVILKNESEGYQLITELRNAPVAEQAVIMQMALVKCDEKGLALCDKYDGISESGGGMLLGGLAGGLLGILGGPIGVLLMGSAGALTGGMADMGGAATGAAMIEMVADKLKEGDLALIILAAEEDEAYLDEKLSKFEGVILRHNAADVAEEVEEAILLQKEMERQARMQLRESRKADVRDHLKERRAEREAALMAEYNARYGE